MSIYQRNHYYRNIYKKHHGSIPKDQDGVSYDIHHIDGDSTNNDITNLVALSRKDHYNVHFEQGDLSACWAIAKRLHLSKNELSSIASYAGKIGGARAKERVANGTHNLLKRSDGTSTSKDLWDSGNHPFKKMRFDGEHNPRYDNTVYTFENLDTKETVCLTQYEFVNKFCLQNYKGNVNAMIKHNRFKHVKRWRVVR